MRHFTDESTPGHLGLDDIAAFTEFIANADQGDEQCLTESGVRR